MFEEPTVGMLATTAGIALVTTIIVEVLLRAVNPAPETKDRFGPLISIGVALVFVLGYGITSGSLGLEHVLLGIFGGWSASGLHDTVSGLSG